MEFLDDTGLAHFWDKIKTKISDHTENKSNPHGVTKAQIGLGNVDNTKDSEKSVLHAKTADRLTGGGTGITLDQVYPVGSIYMSVNYTNPSTLFGGTWSRIEGRFLLGAGTSDGTYKLGRTGGEATHSLTTSEMPMHTHGAHFYTAATEVHNNDYGLAPGGGFGGRGLVYDNSDTPHYPYLHVEGGGQPHNNMPPYLVVNIWKRTA